jgi:beta-glucosidase
LPPFEDYSMKGRTYKYMEAEPLFPFGFGLSYVSFTYNDIAISKNKIKKKGKISISCNVKNEGQMDSDDVSQLYLVPLVAQDILPKYKLLRFKRTKLKSNTTEKVIFDLDAEDFLQINEDGDKVWIKGQYKLIMANALPSQRSQDLGATKPVSTIIELL